MRRGRERGWGGPSCHPPELSCTLLHDGGRVAPLKDAVELQVAEEYAEAGTDVGDAALYGGKSRVKAGTARDAVAARGRHHAGGSAL